MGFTPPRGFPTEITSAHLQTDNKVETRVSGLLDSWPWCFFLLHPTVRPNMKGCFTLQTRKNKLCAAFCSFFFGLKLQIRMTFWYIPNASSGTWWWFIFEGGRLEKRHFGWYLFCFQISWYCWWLKSGINSPVEVGSGNPIIYKVLVPSQVVVWDFSHQQYLSFFHFSPTALAMGSLPI